MKHLSFFLVITLATCFTEFVWCADTAQLCPAFQGTSFEKFLSWTDEKQKTVEVLLKLIASKRGSLLDIGAGDGSVTRFLAPQFDNTTALEPAPNLFEKLSTTCNTSGYDLINKAFEATNLEKKFDVILASHSLQYIPNYAQELIRIKDLLKDSGMLLVIDLDRENCELETFHLKYMYVATSSETNCIPPHKNLLEKYFHVREVPFIATLTIPSVDEAIGIFDLVYNTTLDTIDPKNLAKARADLYQEYGDGPIVLKNRIVIYVCSK
ncbi:TPA: hypothetical protein DDZ86_04310 [Candidatus Dependentiae bacterium]|nr:MAG: Methyltransferase type 12 [candidate division TM6 bacterium GW2011_GWF2_43_87]HBL98838.1 hypothetical protein [Candidatus Dependentiae bacterium]